MGPVPDPHLAKLYRHSVCLVYPSLYEGFGIPPLEAMACDTAVVAAARGSIPEVVGNAASLVDPAAPEEIARAIVRIATDSAERARLVEAGRRRVREFSWDDLADRTVAVYEAVRR